MTVGVLIFIAVVTVMVVIVAVVIDVTSDYFAEKKAERYAREEEQRRIDEWASNMLTIADLHKNAHAIYRRQPGSHRRVKI